MKNAPAKEEAIAESIREVLPGQSDQVYSLIESAAVNFDDVKQAQAFAIMTGRILEASTGQPMQTNGQHNGWFDKNEQPTAHATAPAVIEQEDERPKVGAGGYWGSAGGNTSLQESAKGAGGPADWTKEFDAMTNSVFA